jgi:hypothetical protein
MDLFTITAAGRLIYHRRRYMANQAADARSGFGQPVWVADLDMDFHGDLLIGGATVAGANLSYAVRFTHGIVEWMRPFDSLTEIHRLWLMERGS